MFQRFRRKIIRKLTIFSTGLATIGLIRNYQITSFIQKKKNIKNKKIKKINIVLIQAFKKSNY